MNQSKLAFIAGLLSINLCADFSRGNGSWVQDGYLDLVGSRLMQRSRPVPTTLRTDMRTSSQMLFNCFDVSDSGSLP